MNYIGSKLGLLDFLNDSILEKLKEYKEYRDYNSLWFADGFAGTGIVGRHFKKKGMNIIANDIQYYSYVINKHFIGINEKPSFSKLGFDPFDYFSTLNGKEGFIYKNYSAEGTKGEEHVRNYYTSENAKLIDEIRALIEKWYSNNEINSDEYFYLISSLLEAADKVANTASVYGAFLKHIKKTAKNRLDVKPLEIIEKNIDS